MKKKFFILFFLAIFGKPSFAQKQGQELIDSLLMVLKTAKEDTNKITTLNALAFEFRNTHNDSTILLANEAIILANKQSYKLGLADGYLNVGRAKFNQGDLLDALSNCNKALILYEE